MICDVERIVRRGKIEVEERGGHANGKLCCRKTNIESAARLGRLW